MRVAITGATGFIGRRLVHRLLADGHTLVALTRDVERAHRVLPVRCAAVPWNPEGGEVHAAALRGADAVVHLAGEGVAAGRWTKTRKDAIRTSRVDGTRALVAALGELTAAVRPRVLVAASAIGIYGDRGDTELTEESAPGSGFLADVCRAWEAETAAAAALGMRTTIVRIGVVLGRNGGALERMLPPFRLGAGGRLGGGRQWMSWIHIDDLIELFVLALTDARVSGPLNGVAPRPVTNATFTRALGRALHRPALLPVPALALRVVFGEMATVLLASERVLPRAALRLGFRFAHAEVDDALADLLGDDAVELEFEQWVQRPPADVFAFFCDPRNLEKLTPPFLRFRVVGTSTQDIRSGTRIDYRLSLHGVPVRWQSRIDVWQPDRRFVDSQTRGPYKSWRHTHEFEAHEGGTLVRDRIRYEVPFGAAGALVAGGRVAADVQAIFAFRRRQVDEIFGQSTDAASQDRHDRPPTT
jgi:uncharacterized protein (TIGR01777 family)